MGRELDPELLRWIAVGVMALAVLGIFVALRFVRRVALRIAIVAALVGFGALLWFQRDGLQGCVDRCDCRFLGYEFTPPGCPR